MKYLCPGGLDLVVLGDRSPAVPRAVLLPLPEDSRGWQASRERKQTLHQLHKRGVTPIDVSLARVIRCSPVGSNLVKAQRQRGPRIGPGLPQLGGGGGARGGGGGGLQQ